MGSLPYQAGTTLSDILEATTTEPSTTYSMSSCDHSREVFYVLEMFHMPGKKAISSATKPVWHERQRPKGLLGNIRIDNMRNVISMPNITAKSLSDTKVNDGTPKEDKDVHHCHRQVMNSSIIHNLEFDFEEVRGQKVYNTPEANIMYVKKQLSNDPNLTPELKRYSHARDYNGDVVHMTINIACSFYVHAACLKQRTHHLETVE